MNIFGQNQSFEQFIKQNKVTFVILLINTIMFIMTAILAISYVDNIRNAFNSQAYTLALYNLGGLYPPAVSEGGQYYRIITAMFLHGGMLHFLSNMIIGVFVLSSALERLVKPLKFVLIYFISGIGSGILVVIFSDTLTIGASGAIFGVLGALLYITIYRRDLISHQEAQTIQTLIVINIVFTFIGYRSISVPGHIGGIITGFLLSYLLIRRNVFKVLE